MSWRQSVLTQASEVFPNADIINLIIINEFTESDIPNAHRNDQMPIIKDIVSIITLMKSEPIVLRKYVISEQNA